MSNFVYNRHAMTKHQHYLQLRKDILEERVRCDTENAMILASLALQAEFGDYQPEVQNLFKSSMCYRSASTTSLKSQSCISDSFHLFNLISF